MAKNLTASTDQTAGTDWYEWHSGYDRPGSWLEARLALVQRRLLEAVDEAPAGPIRLVSVCAGQGRDVAGALAGHRRAPELSGRLVERDPRNATMARRLLDEAGLPGVEVLAGDAAATDSYAGAVPAEVVLLCGVLGNITDEDAAHTIDHLPSLCAPGARVIWTRGRRERDVTPAIRSWFAGAGFEEHAFDWATESMAVGVHRLTADPVSLLPGVSLFTFVGFDALEPLRGATR